MLSDVFPVCSEPGERVEAGAIAGCSDGEFDFSSVLPDLAGCTDGGRLGLLFPPVDSLGVGVTLMGTLKSTGGPTGV